jgi:hypothetical protein
MDEPLYFNDEWLEDFYEDEDFPDEEFWEDLDEMEDDPDFLPDADEVGFDPYAGCYTFDC